MEGIKPLERARDPKLIGLWETGRVLGTGISGRVRIARHSLTGQRSAIKIISKTPTPTPGLPEDSDVRRQRLRLEREIVLMKLVDHPNIMRLYDVWESSKRLYCILEYVQGGELYQYVNAKGRCDTLEALSYFQQIIDAVGYCHCFNIVHRDLKPENILLDHHFNIKIADFGMATWQANAQDDMLTTFCGSPHYAAPEVVSGIPYDGAASDIWSCGVILFMLLTGTVPFDADSQPLLLLKVRRGVFTIPSDINPHAQDLIKKMMALDPKQRITVPEIRQHPFFLLQAPKLPPVACPNLEGMSTPLRDVHCIDQAIFANLKTLWHGRADADVEESLLNEERNWEKEIYYLLDQYLKRRLAAFEEEDHGGQQGAEKDNPSENQSTSARLPRPSSPPSPHAAADDVRLSSALRDSGCSRKERMRKDQLTLQEQTDSSSTPSPRDPAKSPLVTLCETLNVSTPHFPELQRPEVQELFQKLLERLPTVKATSSDASPGPSIHSREPCISREEYLPAVNTTLPSPSIAEGQTCRQSEDDLASQYPWCLHALQRNLECPTLVNVPADTLPGSIITVLPDDILLANADGRKSRCTMRGRDITTVERKHSKLKKYRPSSASLSSLSEVDTRVGNYFLPTSGLIWSKSNWLHRVFLSKPATCRILSMHSAHTTRKECMRLLEQLDIHTTLEDSEGLGVLKCRYDGGRDLTGEILKPVTFRVEVQLAEEERWMLSLILIHESGSTDMFQWVWKKLQRDWTLDTMDNITTYSIATSRQHKSNRTTRSCGKELPIKSIPPALPTELSRSHMSHMYLI